jgi:predicted N-acyltransferase
MNAPPVCDLSTGYTLTVCDSIDERNPAQWEPFGAGQADPMMDPRFLRAVERSMGREAKFWNVVIQDATGRSAAAAVVSIYTVDGSLLAQEPWSRIIRALRRVVPRLLQVKVLFCGCPVSTGQSHLRFLPGVDPAPILQRLDQWMQELAWTHGVWLLVFKEFDEQEVSQTEALIPLGYVRADSLPMNEFPTNFHDFDHVCRSYRSRYRNALKHSRRKFDQSGLRVVHLRGSPHLDRLYTDDVHGLYLSVLHRAEVKLECLPAAFFRELACQFPEEFAFTLIYQEDRIVAFTCGLFYHGSYSNLFCGYDHRINRDVDLYHNLMTFDLDFALRQGVRLIHVGQTADEFKARLGCYTRSRCFYIRTRRALGRPVLRAMGPVLFPPAPAVPQRKVFKGDQDQPTTRSFHALSDP